MVGLAGGIGSGKSTVARLLGELGAGVISSDALSHEEINSPEVRETLCSWWGDSIIAAEGRVDRRKVASIVFQDAGQRRRLEALLHPRIAVRRSTMIDEMATDPRVRMIVIDSPLLYESDIDLNCDAVLFVEAAIETRVARSEKDRHWNQTEMERREKSQLPLDKKRARADYVCDNNSGLSALRERVEHIFSQIISASGAA